MGEFCLAFKYNDISGDCSISHKATLGECVDAMDRQISTYVQNDGTVECVQQCPFGKGSENDCYIFGKLMEFLLDFISIS